MLLVKKYVKPLIGISIILIVSLAAVYLYPKLITNLPKSPIPVNKPAKIGPTASLEKLIKTTFASSKYKDIIDYTNLASQEKSLDRRYSYYLKVFNLISKAYRETQNPKYKVVLYKLQDYLKIYPQYNSLDTLIPGEQP